MTQTDTPFDAIIIGAGMSGLLAAIKLTAAGKRFVILERGAQLGGTWADNIYPGSGCDVPAHLYSYSFAPNPAWSRLYALQPEILAYFTQQADRYGITPHIRFDVEAQTASFDAATARWTVTGAGERWTAQFLIVATGQLNQPRFPDIAGRENFAGAQFHSARWDKGVTLTGRRIGVIGSGASVIQFLPQIAPGAAQLTMFQRSPHWIIPRGDKEIPHWRRTLYAKLPAARLAFRALIYRSLEANWVILAQPGGKRSLEFRQAALDNLHGAIADPALRAKLTPDYPMGCKRMLVSDDFYPALARPNVAVETGGIAAIEADGIRLADGTHIPLDVIIWGTGFATHSFVAPLAVTGLNGQQLSDAWADGPQAYRGTAVTGFPNMFVLYGPNTNLGHNSIIFMVERQVGYLMQAIAAAGDGWVDVRPDVQAAYNADIRAQLATTAWAADCGSWYKTKDGTIPNNWPGSTRAFARTLRRFDTAAWHKGPAAAVN